MENGAENGLIELAGGRKIRVKRAFRTLELAQHLANKTLTEEIICVE